MWVVKLPSFFFCLPIYLWTFHQHFQHRGQEICVHVFTPLCNFFNEHERSISFITLITLSSMLCTYYIPNAYLMTNSKIRGPFLSWPDSQSFQSQLFHIYMPTWTSWPLPAARPWWCYFLCPFQGLHHNTRLLYHLPKLLTDSQASLSTNGLLWNPPMSPCHSPVDCTPNTWSYSSHPKPKNACRKALSIIQQMKDIYQPHILNLFFYDPCK